MKKIILSSIVLSSLVLASESKYEITPLVGYVDTKEHVDLKNHKVAGVSVGINKGDDCKFDQIELGILQSIGYADYENSVADTPITRLFVNGIKEYSLNDKFKLYALAGLGYEHIDNEEFNNESGSFFNYGVGAKYKVYNDIALKFDVRHLLKFDGDKNVIYTLGVSIPFGEVVKPMPKTEKKVVVVPKTAPVEEKAVVVPKTAPEEEKVAEPMIQPSNLDVLFDTNSAKIRTYDIAKFDKYIKYISTVSGSKIIVEGHTDSIGSKKYNYDLSQRRAQSVKKQFVKMGVDSNSVEAIGYGESKPTVDNTTKENRQLNRRVTAKIVK